MAGLSDGTTSPLDVVFYPLRKQPRVAREHEWGGVCNEEGYGLLHCSFPGDSDLAALQSAAEF